jgi:hypothetical protein
VGSVEGEAGQGEPRASASGTPRAGLVPGVEGQVRRRSRTGKLLANLLGDDRLNQRPAVVFVAEHGSRRLHVGDVAIDQPCPMFPRVLVQVFKEALPPLTESDGPGEAFLLTQYQGESSMLPQVVIDEPLTIGAANGAPYDDEVGSLGFPLGLHPAIIAEGRAAAEVWRATVGRSAGPSARRRRLGRKLTPRTEPEKLPGARP